MLLVVLGSSIIVAGWLVSVVWLAVLGQWLVIGTGIAAAVAGIAIARTVQLRMPADIGFELGGMLFPFLATLYLHALVVVWNIVVIVACTVSMDGMAARLPTVLWSFGTAMAPWYFSRLLVHGAEIPGDVLGFYGRSIAFIHLGFFIAAVMAFLHYSQIGDFFALFSVVMALATLSQLVFLRRIANQEQERNLQRLVESRERKSGTP